MKIVLTGLGMRSELMDIPESSGTVWDMVLTQPIQEFFSGEGRAIHEKPPFDTRCRFEWTGKHFSYSDGKTAREYVLTDISKL